MRIAMPLIALIMIAAPASAARFEATLAQPVAKKVVGRDISWDCSGATCAGTSELSRPVVLCQGLAKKAGRIDAFVTDGRPLAVAEMAECNRFARAPQQP